MKTTARLLMGVSGSGGGGRGRNRFDHQSQDDFFGHCCLSLDVNLQLRWQVHRRDEGRERGLVGCRLYRYRPGYISRSVAGSYGGEVIAIFLLMLTFFSRIEALKTRSAFFGTVAALFYFYAVAVQGMY